jgi:predicted DNA-binding transcriptional regulator YafY
MGKSSYVDPLDPQRSYSDLMGQVTFVYRNWRGEIGDRRVTPINIVFESNQYHDSAQWFLRGFCHSRHAIRNFAIEDIIGGIRHVRARNNRAFHELNATHAIIEANKHKKIEKK